MTLSKQLIILIAALLLMVFVGTFLISVDNTRDYLEKQLASHAQDAATSLGLSISSHMAEGDLATVRSMTDVIFDRGYYRSIRVEDMAGKPLVDRILPVKIEGVPEWFIERLPLTTPQGESSLMSGWMQAGRVEVRSHPGFAYNQLWQTVAATFRWFIGSMVVVLAVGLLLLRWVMKPLESVEQQANAICNREFQILEELPRTPDLRRIVEAMNRMSEKVKQMLDDLEQLASGLRRKAYQHPVSGLANKRYFMDTLENLIRSPEDFSHGVLCLIQLKDFKEYNDRRGYQAGDNLLQEATKSLKAVVGDRPKQLLAHLAGADFALLVEECSIEESEVLGAELVAALTQLYGTGKLDEPNAGHVGMGYFDGSQTLSELMSEADMALRMAQLKGANEWHLSTPDELEREHIRTATEWREFIGEALGSGQIQLQFQPVVSCPSKTLLHQEVLVRIPEGTGGDGQALLSAGVFMPQAESLGMTAEIDKAVIDKVLDRLRDDAGGETQYAINLSPPSILSPGFMPWLEEELSAHSDIAHRLIFEMQEYGAVALVEQMKELIELVGRHGCQFSLDHFGRSFSSLAYLRSFKVDYLKVDGSFMLSLDENSDNRFFVQALTEIAHGLEIKVIGESVESETVWDILPGLKLDGAQGYYLGRPV
ncbi:MAG: EAL domain-containing protein [Candidatus Sedimenticola sp. (ex Thyasira tokunagai)]